MDCTTLCKSFDQLSSHELYDSLRLRSEVFVVEQHCVFLDLDDQDQACHHVLLYDGSKLVATARLVPPGRAYPEMSIGRVVTAGSVRGIGLGKHLMQVSIREIYAIHGRQPIKIGAQVYAIPFYAQLGFVPEGEIYDEDGIPHLKMVKPA